MGHLQPVGADYVSTYLAWKCLLFLSASSWGVEEVDEGGEEEEEEREREKKTGLGGQMERGEKGKETACISTVYNFTSRVVSSVARSRTNAASRAPFMCIELCFIFLRRKVCFSFRWIRCFGAMRNVCFPDLSNDALL